MGLYDLLYKRTLGVKAWLRFRCSRVKNGRKMSSLIFQNRKSM